MTKLTNNNLTEEELNGLAEEMQLCANRCRHQGWEGNAREYDQIICALRELQQRRKADEQEPVAPDGWIPVSEQMPKPNIFVLVSNGVWVGQGFHSDAEHLEEDERWQDEHYEFIDRLHFPVTHWMPLPATPQQDKYHG